MIAAKAIELCRVNEPPLVRQLYCRTRKGVAVQLPPQRRRLISHTKLNRIRVHDDFESFVPVLIPELDDVRRFAGELHASGKPWTGDTFGWPTEYHAERPEAPLDSKCGGPGLTVFCA